MTKLLLIIAVYIVIFLTTYGALTLTHHIRTYRTARKQQH